MKVRNKILSKGNEEIPVSVTASVLHDEQGRIVGGVESFMDDTVRVTLERKLRRSYAFENIVGKKGPLPMPSVINRAGFNWLKKEPSFSMKSVIFPKTAPISKTGTRQNSKPPTYKGGRDDPP